uniref:Putative disease resistance RPP13-like protein 1 n=1 Tax=Anthurium amnicola TaxID=1678845 RepID=A0A1D1XUT2_9ARAE
MELLAKVGDVVVSSLLAMGLERAIEELKRICRVPEEIQRLTTTVKLIKAVLKDAEEKQVSNEAVRDWLRDLKQAFLDAEDLVDEITTDAALQPMGAEGSKKVRTIIGSIAYKILTAPQIQHINQTIEDLARQKDMLGLQQVTSVENRLVEYRRRQPTSSLLADKTSVIGRDSEKEEIKKLLLSSSFCEAESSNSRSFSILPIVGMGGLGKTTLTRLVYNDEEVKKHFEVKMWVCVSNDFDLIRLTREIIEAASTSKGKNEQCPIPAHWDSLQQKLRQEVEEEVKGALKFCFSGFKELVLNPLKEALAMCLDCWERDKHEAVQAIVGPLSGTWWGSRTPKKQGDPTGSTH